MKSSYEKDLKSINTISNLVICILILIELANSQEVFKWYMKIKVINLMPYLFSNIVILWQGNKNVNMSHGGNFLQLIYDLHNFTFGFVR